MSIATPNGFQLDNSGKRVVVDPITRIEGHLRIEVNVDANNVIRNAVSTGTMWRGLEVILRGRDPRDAWAFVQRICGVCTGVHALASVRGVPRPTTVWNGVFVRAEALFLAVDLTRFANHADADD